MNLRSSALALTVFAGLGLGGCGSTQDRAAADGKASRPVETAVLTYAPAVPPPITRHTPATVVAHLEASVQTTELAPGVKYAFWTFNTRVPGPFIRTRVGDTLEMHITNADITGTPHNIDLHCVTGPGGGATVTTGVKGDHRMVRFKLLHPGIFVYHCAAPPVMDHIANGMYGLILVEPEGGLPKVDHEFYVMQSEFYTNPLAEDTDVATYSHEQGLAENPTYVVFNGRVGSLTGDNMLQARVGEKVRIFFGNGGPNKISSFHLIGEIFDKVYREGDLVSPPARSVQTTLVPAGGAAAVEFGVEVPGTYTLVDHAIFRIEKGAVGFLKVTGAEQPDIFHSVQKPTPCEGCLVHP
ncbi:MAG: nitrite reductase, copper-containing [Planctomycetes bacterium]|nr:nitrite reductase, copper-containing [Planctomycetota bacterium]